MSEYKRAMKRLRSIAPDICEAVQAYTATLRRQIEGERAARLLGQHQTSHVPSVPASEETHLQVRVRHLEKQIESMHRCIEEKECTERRRDVIEKHIQWTKAAVSTCSCLERSGCDVEGDVFLPFLMANIARRLSISANMSMPQAVAMLARIAAKPPMRRKVTSDVMRAYECNKERIDDSCQRDRVL